MHPDKTAKAASGPKFSAPHRHAPWWSAFVLALAVCGGGVVLEFKGGVWAVAGGLIQIQSYVLWLRYLAGSPVLEPKGLFDAVARIAEALAARGSRRKQPSV